MSCNNKMAIVTTLYVIMSLVAMALLGYFLWKCKKNEGFCGACYGIGNETHPNRALIRQLYNDGKLTEYTPQQRMREWA